MNAAAARRIRASALQDRLQLGVGGLRAAAAGGASYAVGTRSTQILSGIAALADSDAGQAADLVGMTPVGSVLVLVPSEMAEFSSWENQGAPGVDEVAGLTFTPPHARPWLLLNPELDLTVDDTTSAAGLALQHTVAHEVFHATTLPSGRQTAPRWLIEGYAEWAAGQVSDVLVRAPTAKPYLPTEKQLYAAKTGADAYYFAASFVGYLMRRKSSAAAALYRAAIKAPGAQIDTLARRYFGQSLATLRASWLAQYSAASTPS